MISFAEIADKTAPVVGKPSADGATTETYRFLSRRLPQLTLYLPKAKVNVQFIALNRSIGRVVLDDPAHAEEVRWCIAQGHADGVIEDADGSKEELLLHPVE